MSLHDINPQPVEYGPDAPPDAIARRPFGSRMRAFAKRAGIGLAVVAALGLFLLWVTFLAWVAYRAAAWLFG